jgi:hypothetical protein
LDEIVGQNREGKDGLDLGQSANLDLSDAGSRLEPAEHLFDAFAAALADVVASVAQGASI